MAGKKPIRLVRAGQKAQKAWRNFDRAEKMSIKAQQKMELARRKAWEVEREKKEIEAEGKPIGNNVNFKGNHDTLESVFGPNEISSGDMLTKLWEYVKQNKLLKPVYSRKK